MAKPRTAPKKTAPKKTAPEKIPARDGVDAELAQLAVIRAQFAPLNDAEAAAMYARHTEEQCRDRAVSTKALDTFRGAMSWARTLGEHASDPAVHGKRARWFLDCVTALGAHLTGDGSGGNPAFQATFDDAERRAQRLVKRTASKLRDAAGAKEEDLARIDAALAQNGAGNKHANRAHALAQQIRAWLGSEGAPPLAMFDLDADTAAALEKCASEIDALITKRPAAREVARDAPETNVAEGRMLFAMRTLWNDASNAREDLRSKLQYTVTPALLRGLNLDRSDRRSKPEAE